MSEEKKYMAHMVDFENSIGAFDKKIDEFEDEFEKLAVDILTQASKVQKYSGISVSRLGMSLITRTIAIIKMCAWLFEDGIKREIQLYDYLDAAEFEARVAAKLLEYTGTTVCPDRTTSCPVCHCADCRFCCLRQARIDVEEEMSKTSQI